MKKLCWSLLSLIFVFSNAYAQEITDPEKALKSASKAYDNFNLDPNGSSAKLDEAKKNIDFAATNDVTKGLCKTQNLKGSIYSSLCDRDQNNQLIAATKKMEFKSAFPDAALESYKAFKKGLELGQKKWEKGDAIKGLRDCNNHLRNMGSDKYSEKNVKSAYECFAAVVDIQEILKTSGEKNTLTEEEISKYRFYAGICATSAGMKAEARPILEKLYAAKYNDPAVYENLYKLKYDEDKAAAILILEEGRKKFPDDSSLLFSEINHYLKENKLDILTDKLKLAISKEPNNVALYLTLGNIYDNLYQNNLASGNEAKAKENFDFALDYYGQALKKDPKYVDALYSCGALYYNKAAAKTKELQKLADDYSSEGQKKYDKLTAEIKEIFGQALPYFQKAESYNANDRNTLIALKEIFAKTSDLEKAKEFKARFDKVEAKGKNESSYFKN